MRPLHVKKTGHMFKKRYEHIIRETSRRSLALSRGSREAILAKKMIYLNQIEEAEEYIRLLRLTCALLDTELEYADDQVTTVKSVLQSKGIPEISLSDYEDDDFVVAEQFTSP